MAEAKQRLKPTKPGNTTIRVAPKVEIPEFKVPPESMQPIADAITQLGAAIAQIAATQTQILQALSQQQQPKIDVQVPEPKVTMAPRPREFYVELEKDDGETVGMRISAGSPH